MQDISKINELLTVDSSIEKKRKNYSLSVLIILAGIFMVIYSGKNHIPSNLEPLIIVLKLIGFVAFLIGIINISTPSRKLIHKTTGEKIKKLVLYFDLQKENVVMEKLLEGKFNILKEIAEESNEGPLMAEIYYTESGDFSVAQIQKYVSYQYEPIMKPNVLKE